MDRLLNILNLNTVLALISASTLIFAGCGQQEFNVAKTVSSQKAPGTYVIPPKIDFLLAEDDTGSIIEAYAPIAAQLPRFLIDLENKGWDYHFATTPLTHERNFTEIVASKYDINWGSLWQPAYPGALPESAGMITPSLFRRPEQYSGFIRSGTNELNGSEPGFETIRRALYNHVSGTGFLRSDALLVILIVGNGDDTSGVTICTREFGYVGACEDIGMPGGTKLSSFNYYRDQFVARKSSPAQVKLFSAVSKDAQPNCLGGKSYVGSRYQQMALNLGGSHYDICSQPITSVLSDLAASLQIQRLSFRTRFLFIEHKPELASLKVEKFLNGDPAQAVEIPESATNGWTYEGYLNNVFAIDSPVNLNSSSGYAIELHGSAKLVGNDTADVTYKPADAHDSSR